MQPTQRPNPFLELLRPIIELGTAYCAKRAALNELAHCDQLELARVAQDLGISTADLCVVAARDKTAADLLNRRLDPVLVNRDPWVLQTSTTRKKFDRMPG